MIKYTPQRYQMILDMMKNAEEPLEISELCIEEVISLSSMVERSKEGLLGFMFCEVRLHYSEILNNLEGQIYSIWEDKERIELDIKSVRL